MIRLTDDEIYKLNKADTEARKHLFWESGVLDTCKAVSKAQLKKIVGELIKRGIISKPDNEGRFTFKVFLPDEEVRYFIEDLVKEIQEG